MFNSWMPVRGGPCGEFNSDCERYRLVHRAFNDGNFGAGWQSCSILPLKVRWRQHRVRASMRLLRIRLRCQEDAKAAQEGGCCGNVFHGLSPSEFQAQARPLFSHPAPVAIVRVSSGYHVIPTIAPYHIVVGNTTLCITTDLIRHAPFGPQSAIRRCRLRCPVC
jgi:hypothetical protein